MCCECSTTLSPCSAEIGMNVTSWTSSFAARLLEHALAGVDEHDRGVRRGGAGDHVAGVLLVTRGVGDDEAPPRCGEVAVGDVDRDALLALGAQAVGEQGEVGHGVAPAP